MSGKPIVQVIIEFLRVLSTGSLVGGLILFIMNLYPSIFSRGRMGCLFFSEERTCWYFISSYCSWSILCKEQKNNYGSHVAADCNPLILIKVTWCDKVLWTWPKDWVNHVHWSRFLCHDCVLYFYVYFHCYDSHACIFRLIIRVMRMVKWWNKKYVKCKDHLLPGYLMLEIWG